MSTVAKLKDALHKRGLSTNGKKAELQARLLDAVTSNDESTADSPAPKRPRTDGSTQESQESTTTVDESSLCQKLECPICVKVILPPIHQCKEGHLICGDCKDKVNNRCPSCKSWLSYIRNRALEDIAGTMKFPCDNEKAGCKELLSYGSIKDHREKCDYRCVRCLLDRDCEFEGSWKELLEHYRQDDVDFSYGCYKFEPLRIVPTSSPESEDVLEYTKSTIMEVWKKDGSSFVPRVDGRLIMLLLLEGMGGAIMFTTDTRGPNHTSSPYVYFYAWFVGPESERDKYSIKVSMENEGHEAVITFGLLPLKAQQASAPSESVDVVPLSFSHLERFREEEIIPFNITIRKRK